MYTIFHTIRKATPHLIRLDYCQQLRKIQVVASGLCGKRLEEEMYKTLLIAIIIIFDDECKID